MEKKDIAIAMSLHFANSRSGANSALSVLADIHLWSQNALLNIASQPSFLRLRIEEFVTREATGIKLLEQRFGALMRTLSKAELGLAGRMLAVAWHRDKGQVDLAGNF